MLLIPSNKQWSLWRRFVVANKTVCDRCGATCLDVKQDMRSEYGMYHSRGKAQIGCHFDLCLECSKELERWMKPVMG